MNKNRTFTMRILAMCLVLAAFIPFVTQINAAPAENIIAFFPKEDTPENNNLVQTVASQPLAVTVIDNNSKDPTEPALPNKTAPTTTDERKIATKKLTKSIEPEFISPIDKLPEASVPKPVDPPQSTIHAERPVFTKPIDPTGKLLVPNSGKLPEAGIPKPIEITTPVEGPDSPGEDIVKPTNPNIELPESNLGELPEVSIPTPVHPPRFIDENNVPEEDADPTEPVVTIPEDDEAPGNGDGEACPKCGRNLWSPSNPHGCFTFLTDTKCDCGKLVHAMECHHH